MAELYVNVNGTWKQASNYYVNVNGTWKEGSELHAKVSSAWKESGGTASGLITTNLVLHLDASDNSSYGGSGTTWTDLSNSSNNGTLTNGPTYSSDFGGVIVFDGTNDYVQTGSDMFNANADFTFSTWIFADTLGTSPPDAIISDNDNTESIYIRYNSGSGIQVVKNNVSVLGTFSSSTLSTNTWYNITIVRSSSDASPNTYTLYLNGSSISSFTSGTSFTHGAQTIGMNYNGNAPFDGKIGQVFAYSSALSASDVLSNYNATKSHYTTVITTNLVLHLDATNSSSYSGSGTTWTDLSDEGNDATLVNGPTYSSSNGGYLSFDGTNDHATISSAADLGGFSGDFTIEFWFKGPDQSAYSILFEHYNSSSGQRWSIQAENTGTTNLWWTRDTITKMTTSGIDAFDDDWHHHVISRNGSTITYYIDNVSRDTETYSGTFSSGTDLIIGQYSGGSYNMEGDLSQLRIYSGKGLTAGEVQHNYNVHKSTYGH